MRFSSETTVDGVSQRLFTVDGVPGVLWMPPGGGTGRPLVLVAHGGGQHKTAPGVVARAHRYVKDLGYAAAAIDAPGHGDRPRGDADFGAGLRALLSSGRPVGPYVARYNADVATRAAPEWRAALDALSKLEFGPVGFFGLSQGAGIGVRLVAAEPRIGAAVLGLVGDLALVALAGGITVPVEFLMQWDDEFVAREDALALFDALGSAEKSLHANQGTHVAVPRFEVDSSVRFFARHLLSGAVVGE